VRTPNFSLLERNFVVVMKDKAFINFDPNEEDLNHLAIISLNISDSQENCSEDSVSRHYYQVEDVELIKIHGRTSYVYKFDDGSVIETVTELLFGDFDDTFVIDYETLNTIPFEYADAEEFYGHLRKSPEKIFEAYTKNKGICPDKARLMTARIKRP
jgi:hypothetical protein